METVRVDLRKLQVLNDRINQTIDALTQLRQSVHGFQPTALAGGLQHSSGIGYASPFGVGSTISPAFASGMGSPFAGGIPQSPTGFGVGQGAWWGPAGLSHSTFGGMEMNPWGRYVDQASAFRIAQSFPYAFAPMAPVVAL